MLKINLKRTLFEADHVMENSVLQLKKDNTDATIRNLERSNLTPSFHFWRFDLAVRAPQRDTLQAAQNLD